MKRARTATSWLQPEDFHIASATIGRLNSLTSNRPSVFAKISMPASVLESLKKLDFDDWADVKVGSLRTWLSDSMPRVLVCFVSISTVLHTGDDEVHRRTD